MTVTIEPQAVRDLLDSGDLGSIRDSLQDEHPADIVNLIGDLEAHEVWQILDQFSLTKQADVLGYFPADYQADVAEAAPSSKLAKLVTEMNSDERADLYNRLSDAHQRSLMPALAHAEREDIRRLSSHTQGTAGAIMTSDYAALRPDITIQRALEILRREAPDKETIYRAYVIDAERKLIGTVRLQTLILSEPDLRIEDVMERNSHAVHTEDDQEEVAQRIAKYDVLAIPVIDDEGRLVGIVTHDDAMDVQQEEATEDFHKVGTVGSMLGNVREASIGLLYQKRVHWLLLLVFVNILSGAGIAYYEATIEAYVALVFFLPLLVASSGNAGAQASTLMVRALATGEVIMKDWGKMLLREVIVALMLGLTMAAAVSVIGLVRNGPEIALVVGLTMVSVVLIGSLVGMSLPFLLSKFNLDPATASAPLVTSIADVAGVLIYLSIATVVLFPAIS